MERSTGFSTVWNDRYRESTHLSVWPWSDLVSFTHRFAPPAKGFRRVLEMGCGAGANIPFFVRSGCDYHGVDGSAHIVQRLQEAFPELKAQLQVADFTVQVPFAGPFDLIVDRGSITCNDLVGVRAALALAFEALRPGGKLLAIDWFSREHEDATGGTEVDRFTRTAIGSPALQGCGKIHFSDEAHLRELLSEASFELEALEHKTRGFVVGAGPRKSAFWSFVAVKPA